MNRHTTEPIGELLEKIRILEEKVYRDSLTGSYNRRFYDEMLFVPNGNLPCPAPVTFIMADVKKFKLINDTFGHLAGDECLKKIAEILADTFKKEDIIIRYGGDEFLVIQWSNNVEQTAVFINNVRQRIRSLRFSGYPGLCLDVNMGYAISAAPIQSKDDCTALLNAADTQMYREKAP